MKKHSSHPHLRRMTNYLTKSAVIIIMLGFTGLLLFSAFQNDESAPDTLITDVTEAVDTMEVSDTLQAADMQDTTMTSGETVSEEPEEEEELTFTRGEYTSRQIRIGERLFNGLVAFESGTHECSSCHYTEPQEEINWNPATFEMALVWEADTAYDLMNIMNNPPTLKMMEDHAGMKITAEEAHMIEGYYTKVLEAGPGELHALPVRAFLFWGLGFLMLLALIDLVITRKIKFIGLHVLVLFIGLAVHGQFAVVEAQRLGRTKDYAPSQPIKFSHLIHAQENQIDCEYCHYISDYSQSGGIPSNNVCLNCHSVVRNGTNSGAFEINKIHAAEESGKPVEWIRVHDLPDHSFFSHAQHVNAGQLDCTECHGDVENMHIVQQQETLAMGWCLSCHRENAVNFDNPYYDMYDELHAKIRAGEIDSVVAADLGGEDCMTCHY